MLEVVPVAALEGVPFCEFVAVPLAVGAVLAVVPEVWGQLELAAVPLAPELFIVEPVVPAFVPALPVEPLEPLVLALVLPVAPSELPVEPVVAVPPIVPVEPVVPLGVVVVVDPELLGRDPVVLLCPEPMLFGVVVELAPELVDVPDCPAVLPGVVADVAPTVPAVPPG